MKFLLILSIFLVSCAGYRFEGNKNPFAQYDIKSLAIPMFINRTGLANVSGHFTREIALTLSQYSGLKVLAGEALGADAVLVGILKSSQKQRNIIKNLSRIYSEDQQFSSAIGDRSDFYVPNSTQIDLSLQLVLIKNPTSVEKKLIANQTLAKSLRSPKILINVELSSSGSFARTIKGGTSPDSGTAVNFVSNHGLINRTLRSMAEGLAVQFKETIANAF